MSNLTKEDFNILKQDAESAIENGWRFPNDVEQAERIISALHEIEKLQDIIRKASEENAKSTAMNMWVHEILEKGYVEK